MRRFMWSPLDQLSRLICDRLLFQFCFLKTEALDSRTLKIHPVSSCNSSLNYVERTSSESNKVP